MHLIVEQADSEGHPTAVVSSDGRYRWLSVQHELLHDLQTGHLLAHDGHMDAQSGTFLAVPPEVKRDVVDFFAALVVLIADRDKVVQIGPHATN